MWVWIILGSILVLLNVFGIWCCCRVGALSDKHTKNIHKTKEEQ